jgi:DTW domain-containing protein YfiP
VPAVPTVTRLVILRHTLERHRPSNSARWAALALPAARLVEYGGVGDGTGPELPPGSWLLYPGPGPAPAGRPETLVVLDGSWSQTRRMLQRIPGLAALPRLPLPPGRPRPRLRRAPPGGLATLEAIACALALYEGPAVGAALDGLYDEAVRRSS